MIYENYNENLFFIYQFTCVLRVADIFLVCGCLGSNYFNIEKLVLDKPYHLVKAGVATKTSGISLGVVSPGFGLKSTSSLVIPSGNLQLNL